MSDLDRFDHSDLDHSQLAVRGLLARAVPERMSTRDLVSPAVVRVAQHRRRRRMGAVTGVASALVVAALAVTAAVGGPGAASGSHDASASAAGRGAVSPVLVSDMQRLEDMRATVARVLPAGHSLTADGVERTETTDPRGNKVFLGYFFLGTAGTKAFNSLRVVVAPYFGEGLKEEMGSRGCFTPAWRLSYTSCTATAVPGGRLLVYSTPGDTKQYLVENIRADGTVVQVSIMSDDWAKDTGGVTSDPRHAARTANGVWAVNQTAPGSALTPAQLVAIATDADVISLAESIGTTLPATG
jgi:hypothetical protein